MGLTFSSTQLADTHDGFQSSSAFSTSYAFNPTDTNYFGIEATLTYSAELGDITPVLYLPARDDGNPPPGYTCNPIPSSSNSDAAQTVSVLCPSIPNLFFDTPGTVGLDFFGNDDIGLYQFSVTTLGTSTVSVGTGAPTTSTGTTATATATATETTYLHTVVETAGRKTVQGPCAKTTASGAFPSGAGPYPSGSGEVSGVFPSGTSVPSGVFPSGKAGVPSGVLRSGTGSVPSGVLPSGTVKPSGSGYVPSSGMSPSGSGVRPSGSGYSAPLGSGVNPSRSGIYPSGTAGIPTGSPPPIYPTGTVPKYPSGSPSTGSKPVYPSPSGISASFPQSGTHAPIQTSVTGSLPFYPTGSGSQNPSSIGSSGRISSAGPPASGSLSITYPFGSNSRTSSLPEQSHGTHQSHQPHGSHHTHRASNSGAASRSAPNLHGSGSVAATTQEHKSILTSQTASLKSAGSSGGASPTQGHAFSGASKERTTVTVKSTTYVCPTPTTCDTTKSTLEKRVVPTIEADPVNYGGPEFTLCDTCSQFSIMTTTTGATETTTTMITDTIDTSTSTVFLPGFTDNGVTLTITTIPASCAPVMTGSAASLMLPPPSSTTAGSLPPVTPTVTSPASTVTDCVATAVNPAPAGSVCGAFGYFSNMEDALSSSGYGVDTLDDCAATCLENAQCQTFTYDTNDKECTLYAVTPTEGDFNPEPSGVTYYESDCFACAGPSQLAVITP